MKPLDLLDCFDKSSSAIAFVATYEFNPQFFERRVLAKRAYGSADRVVVFMDRGRYADLLGSGLVTGGFNRRYLVVPMDRAPYAFHPKLYLMLGETRAEAVIGSSNCTNAGVAYNVEICSAFSVSADRSDATDRDAKHIVRRTFDVFRQFAADAGPLRELVEKEYLGPAERCVPWLDQKIALPKGEVELLDSYRLPLWQQIQPRLKELKVRKISVVSPFFDAGLGFLKKLRSLWPDASLSVIAQEEYATLPGDKLRTILTKKKDWLFAAEIKPGRRLHAKAFGFETAKGTYWITGSANATTAAFEGRNTETVLCFRTKESADALLDAGPFKLKKVAPDEFVPGTQQEPASQSTAAGSLAIHTAILGTQGILECQAQGFHDVRDISLRIRNFNEPAPVLSIPLKFGEGGRASVALDDGHMAQLHGAALCQLKGLDAEGGDVLSQEVALAQFNQLLKERGSGSGARNPLQNIAETGENLVPYVDSLGSVRDAVEFFNSCSIRFFDGETTKHGFRDGSWKQRDPFKPDTPPAWGNLPAGGSVEDLREAIWDFVERHQWEKLNKHARRGNLNGLPNFLDIFRTLNGLLLAYHARTLGSSGAIIPFGFVVRGMMINLELLIGPYETGEAEWYEGSGFVAAVSKNMAGDKDLVCERLQEECVPEMLWAAIDALVACRARALRLREPDPWALGRLGWVAAWIDSQGFKQPTAEAVKAARAEYAPIATAA